MVVTTVAREMKVPLLPEEPLQLVVQGKLCGSPCPQSVELTDASTDHVVDTVWNPLGELQAHSFTYVGCSTVQI
jgi:hypothetical protein